MELFASCPIFRPKGRLKLDADCFEDRWAEISEEDAQNILEEKGLFDFNEEIEANNVPVVDQFQEEEQQPKQVEKYCKVRYHSGEDSDNSFWSLHELLLAGTEALIEVFSEASGVIEAAQTLAIGIEMLADALGATASERMASGAGRAAGLTLVESVVIEMKI